MNGLAMQVDQLEHDVAVIGGVVFELEVSVGIGIDEVEIGGLCGGEGCGGRRIGEQGCGVISVGGDNGGCGARDAASPFDKGVFDILLSAFLFGELDVDVIGSVGNHHAGGVFAIPGKGQ